MNISEDVDGKTCGVGSLKWHEKGSTASGGGGRYKSPREIFSHMKGKKLTAVGDVTALQKHEKLDL